MSRCSDAAQSPVREAVAEPVSEAGCRRFVEGPVGERRRNIVLAIQGLTDSVTVGRDIGPEGRSIHVPVSQDRSKALRDALLENATGLRRP